MHLTLSEAAAHAKMPSEVLLRHIENDELLAERSSDDAQYRIHEEDLEAFLGKKAFENFWKNDDEADNAPAKKQPLTQSGNLRRVLTAEAVADLKIEHQVLTSRVETLERLFSEFMAMEKTENTLVLEDSWKIEPIMVQEKSTPPVRDQAQSYVQNDDGVISNDPTPLKDPRDNVAEKVVMAAREIKPDNNTNEDDVELQTKEDIRSLKSEPERGAKYALLQQASKKDVNKSEVKSAKSKSAKDLLTKKLMNASNDRLHAEEGQEQKPSKEKLQADSPISARLAEYERRLVEAKNTATRIWH